MATFDKPKRKRYSDYPPETQRAIDGIIAIGVRMVRRPRPKGLAERSV